MWITIIILLLGSAAWETFLRHQFLKKLPNMTHVHTYKIQNFTIKWEKISIGQIHRWNVQLHHFWSTWFPSLTDLTACAHLTNFEKFSFSPFLVVTSSLKSLNLWNCFHKHLWNIYVSANQPSFVTDLTAICKLYLGQIPAYFQNCFIKVKLQKLLLHNHLSAHSESLIYETAFNLPQEGWWQI